jgi:hypothetical protein
LAIFQEGRVFQKNPLRKRFVPRGNIFHRGRLPVPRGLPVPREHSSTKKNYQFQEEAVYFINNWMVLSFSMAESSSRRKLLARSIVDNKHSCNGF